MKTPLVVARQQTKKTSSKDPRVTIRPKKIELYQVIRAAEHTIVVKEDGLHNVVSVNRVLLARSASEYVIRCNVTEDVTNDYNKQEATPDVGNERGYTQHSCDPESGTEKQRHIEDFNDELQEYCMWCRRLLINVRTVKELFIIYFGLDIVPTRTLGNQVKMSRNSLLRHIERKVKLLQKITVKKKKAPKAKKLNKQIKNTKSVRYQGPSGEDVV